MKAGIQIGAVLAVIAAIPAVISELIARGSGGARNFVVAVPAYFLAGALAGGLTGLMRQHLHRRSVAMLIGSVVGPLLGIAIGFMLGKLGEGDFFFWPSMGLFMGLILSNVIWAEIRGKRW